MGIGNCQARNKQRDNVVEDFVAENNEIIFSCESSRKGEDRELFLTETSVIVRYRTRGESISINQSVKLKDCGNNYQIAIDKYGLRISEERFNEFWKELCRLRQTND